MATTDVARSIFDLVLTRPAHAHHAHQNAAPPARVAEAVRGLVGPLVRPVKRVTALFARLQRVFFLIEGRDIGR